eukprot:35642_1
MQPSNERKPVSFHYRKWLVLFGSILLQLSIGSMFVFGNGIPYIASYITHASLLIEKQDIDGIIQQSNNDAYAKYIYYLSQCNWIFTTCYIVFVLSCLMGGHIQQQIGVKTTLILSCLLMLIGTLLCYFTLVNLYALIFCYLLFGCGAGIAYPISFISCLAWFKQTGSKMNIKNNTNYMIIVLLNVCFACSPFIFAPIQLSIINPQNIPIHAKYGFIGHHDIMQHIPLSYLYFTLIIGIMQLIAIILISNPTLNKLNKKVETSIHEHDDDIVDNMNVAVPPHSCACHRVKYIAYNSIYDIKYNGDTAYYQMKPYEVLLNGKFWHLWMIHLCSMIVYFFIILFWKIFAIQFISIYDDKYLTATIAIAFILNGIWRLIWYKIYFLMETIIKKKMILFIITIILCIFVASIALSKVAKIIYAIWICIIFCMIGCDWILYPSLIAITFGQKYSGNIMGYCLLADIPAIIIVVCLCNHLYDMNMNNIHGYSWEAFTWIMAAVLIFSILLIVVFDPKKVIAERQLKDTMRTVQFPSYNSINYTDTDDVNDCKKNCGCPKNCNCCHDDS